MSVPGTALHCNSLVATGTEVRVRRDISLCVGLVPIPSVGVFLQFKIARQIFEPSALHLVRMDLAMFTADSALPFDLGYRGELVIC